MILHLFNSSSVSGPERLVLPALTNFKDHFMIVNLREMRIPQLRESDPLGEYSRSLNLGYRHVSVKGRWDRGAVKELQDLVDQLNPDLVHAHDVKASVYLYQSKKSGQTRKPFRTVSTHHGVHGRPDRKTQLYEWLYRRHFLKFFDRVLCVSTADYEFLSRSGIGKDRLRLHLNGLEGRLIDPEFRFQEAQKIRTRWQSGDMSLDNLFLFGVVGRLSTEKDHARILNVLSHLNNLPCERNWRCLIFGSGPLSDLLQQFAQRLGLQQRVLWMGYRQNVGDELAGLDLLLSFSKAEGLPINLIEAGWSGTPVMCTKVGGVRDLIPDESYGNWVLPEESIEKSARRLQRFLSEEGRMKLRNQGRRFQKRVAKEFTQKKWVQQLENIYTELKVGFREMRS